MKLRADTDQDWRTFGEIDPLYGVLSQEQYRASKITPDSKKAFYQSGEEHVDKCLALIQSHFGATRKDRALDFGCGVGRLVLPLSHHFAEVTGVDISQEMMARAKAAASESGITNITFVDSIAQLIDSRLSFDLVHTFIVLQHIPCKRGFKIIDDLLTLTRPNGILAVQITYGHQRGALRTRIRELSKNILPLRYAANLLMKRHWNRPAMQLNHYSLPQLFQRLVASGITDYFVVHTNHGGALGLFIFMQKPESPNRDFHQK